MSSLYDDLVEKIRQDPRLTKRSGARADLTLTMFNAHESVRDLWVAAETEIASARSEGRDPSPELIAAVEELRPIFGPRGA
jgi:hypothetical protein